MNTIHIGEQSEDDKGSLTFDTDKFEQDVTFLGQPELTITLSANKPIANAFIRLNVIDQKPKKANMLEPYQLKPR